MNTVDFHSSYYTRFQNIPVMFWGYWGGACDGKRPTNGPWIPRGVCVPSCPLTHISHNAAARPLVLISWRTVRDIYKQTNHLLLIKYWSRQILSQTESEHQTSSYNHHREGGGHLWPIKCRQSAGQTNWSINQFKSHYIINGTVKFRGPLVPETEPNLHELLLETVSNYCHCESISQ